MLANEPLKIEPNMSVDKYSAPRMDTQGSLKLDDATVEPKGPMIKQIIVLKTKPSEQNEPKQEKTRNVTRSKKQLNVEECLDKQGKLHREAIETMLLALFGLANLCCSVIRTIKKYLDN
eukprot:15364599-Ditylum_brightwellii.AAC.9